MSGHLDPFCYESHRVIRATPARVWAVVSRLETWNRFYPGTVRATYLGQDVDVPRAGATVVEKYLARSGYAVLRHEILQVREPGLIEWEGRIIDAPVLVGNPEAAQIRAIRGRFAYLVEAVPEGVRWRRTCRFHTTDPAGEDIYVAFMREFFPGLTESLEVYMDLVREHVEQSAERP
jgi:hypothetical protein